jgi:hypothetical protein
MCYMAYLFISVQPLRYMINAVIVENNEVIDNWKVIARTRKITI